MAQTRRRWLGLESIKVGDVALSTIGHYITTTLTQIECIVPGSARLGIDIPDVTDIMCEDDADPDISVSNVTQAKVIEFSTIDMSTTNLVLAFGGTVSGQIYLFPTAPDNIREKGVELITEIINDTKFKVQVGTALMLGGSEQPMARLSPTAGQLDFSFKVMKSLSVGGTLAPPLKMSTV